MYKYVPLLFFCFFHLSLPAEEVQFGIEGDVKPLGYRKVGELQGLHVDLVKLLFQGTDFQVSFKGTTWERSVTEVSMGKLDLALAIIIMEVTPADYPHDILFSSIPLYTSKFVAYTRVEDNLSLASLEDLYHYRIGVIRTPSEFRQNVFSTPLQNVERFDNHGKIVKSLSHGRVDIAIGDNVALFYAISELKLWKKIKPSLVMGEISRHIVMSKNNHRLRDKIFSVINQRLSEVHANGSVTKLVEHYKLLNAKE